MYQYYDIEEDVIIEVNAKTPLAAAKKIWRRKKSLTIFDITDIDTGEIFKMDSSHWSRKGKFLQ